MRPRSQSSRTGVLEHAARYHYDVGTVGEKSPAVRRLTRPIVVTPGCNLWITQNQQFQVKVQER